MSKGAMPILVGAGQSLSSGRGDGAISAAPSPLKLMTEAAKSALEHTGQSDHVLSAIDTLVAVRTMEDSAPFGHPHGHNQNLPGTLARDLGAAPARLIYTRVGGQTPQAMVNEMAARIYEGEIECALIAGAEATGASKLARKQGIELDWSDTDDRAVEDRGTGARLLCRTEIKHGLVSPAYLYALFETAIAAREGRSQSQHRQAMADLFAPFSEVAAANPYAQFPKRRSAEFLATASEENYALASPYLKWLIAQDAVNMGAAILMMSEEKADALGIGSDKRIYLHGSGEAHDTLISERLALDRSWAMEQALNRALDAAGKAIGDIDLVDLYSCFPCAVVSACDALGIDWQNEVRPLTVTGGLPFAGGPGNNYSLHAIAAMHEKLRTAPEAFGLILANGGWMSKEAAGIYSAQKPDEFAAPEPPAKQMEVVEIAQSPSSGTLETYTVIPSRKGPARAIAFGRTEDMKRFIAIAAPDAIDALCQDDNQCGRHITVTTQDEINTFDFA